MKTLICDCNQTMPLDAQALRQALATTPGASPEGLEQVHSLLCRREAGAFQRAAIATGAGDDLLVACTQEQRLFLELAGQTEGAAATDVRPIRFVNIRESGGWSRDARQATPKIAALLAAAQLPPPEPVATVGYASSGRCLVIGSAEAAEHAAAMLATKLDVTLLVDGGPIAQDHAHPVHHGRLKRLTGWLGAFEAEWESSNPIDLDLCTRCNACVEACPEGAIGLGYQIDMSRCTQHRDCVRVCGAAGAIDFARAPQATVERFDLVLDLQTESAFRMHQPPQGYFGTAGNRELLVEAVLALREMTGEFEKPRFFNYEQRLCTHSRNEQIGCSACIDVCSAQAVRSDATQKGKTRAGKAGGGIVVEPHLCVGCGACTTVCPSGALSYAYPGVPDQGKRLRTLLGTYASAGGRDAALLLHSQEAGTRRVESLGRAARIDRKLNGVPARVLPLPLFHVASAGLDLWLSAIAYGASQVWVLLTGEEAPQYRQALAEQIAVGQAILSGMGFAGEHLRLIDAADDHALDAALRAPPAQGVAQRATFATQAEKRGTLEFALGHLLKEAPQAADAIPLPIAGSPFGSLRVDTERCTLCLACVSACPPHALGDNPDRPQLQFTEKACVQCGLCALTCPEDAITLEPRLWLADAGRARAKPRVLNEMAPYQCIRCSKPFGTLKAIEMMIGKLAGHSAFQGAAAERLKMCSDCRVIDMHTRSDEVRILDVPK